MAKPIQVTFKKEPGQGALLRVAQEWGHDVALVGGLCVAYMVLGEISVILPAMALLVALGFYGTGGVQDVLVFTDNGRRITRRVRCFGFPIKTEVFQGSAPAFMLLGTFGEVGGRRIFRWTYRPVLMLQDGTPIPFSRAMEDSVRMQKAVLKAAHYLQIPVRTAPLDEEFLPPRAGYVDMRTHLQTRSRSDSENFHQNAYMEGMKKMMLVAMAIGFSLAIFFTTQQ